MAEPAGKDLEQRRKAGGALVLLLLVVFIAWRCSQDPGASTSGPGPDASASSEPKVGSAAAAREHELAGLSAPIAAAHVAGGDVIVAGLDLASKAIRAQRIDSKDAIVSERIVLSDVAWSSDADLKVVASPLGVAVTWRGLRAGKLVRQLVILGPDLAPKGEPAEVAAASCATRDAVWFSDGSHALARPWTGAPIKVGLPKEKDASLLCGQYQAYAVLEEEDRTSLLPLMPDGGGTPSTVVRENDFGDDEQRELSEYTVGDDVGFVRLATSGAVALRELSSGKLGPLHKLKTTIPKDDDVVIVDASPRVVVIVYTHDVSETLAPTVAPDSAALPESAGVCMKVAALRVDRDSFEESVVELSPGRCGHEVGPFYTSALGDAVSVAWAERTGGAGRARAPIVSLAHALVASTGKPELARIEQPADALVDAGCAATGCYAVALARREGADAMAPGFAKVLRY